MAEHSCKSERKVKVKSPSHVQLYATPWTVTYQAPPSMGFPRQEYRVGCHSFLQVIFPTQGLNPDLPHCRQILYHLRHQYQALHDTKIRVMLFMGFPGSSEVKNSPPSSGATGDMGFIQIRKISWRRAWQITPVILSGESHGQRSLMGCIP